MVVGRFGVPPLLIACEFNHPMRVETKLTTSVILAGLHLVIIDSMADAMAMHFEIFAANG